VDGFGDQVVIEHSNGFTSYYGHLSRFGPGIKESKKVEQNQIIGYVGSTGLSTGPHLDYRLSRNGQFINPQKETFPTGQPIGKKELDAFCKRRDDALTWLKEDVPSGIPNKGVVQ
jgi:murein DD-endopeptidase MepM/ murein hydrolase activator NlpD